MTPTGSAQPAETDAPPLQEPADAARPRGARGLQEDLARSFEQEGVPPRRRAQLLAFASTPVFRIGLCVLALALLGAVPALRLLTPMSTEAVVNSPLLVVAADIDGTFATANPPTPGRFIHQGEVIGRIVNPLVSKTNQVALEGGLSKKQAEAAELKSRVSLLERLHDQSLKRARIYDALKISQLQLTREADLAAVTSAEAALKTARAALERSQQLNAQGWGTAVAVERDQASLAAAESGLTAAKAAAGKTLAAIGAARSGVVALDGFNDESSSAQQAREIEVQLIALKGDLVQAQDEALNLARQVEEEKRTVGLQGRQTLTSPWSGQVWEASIQPGESVRRGQPVLKVVDCAQLRITANVAEGIFNRLLRGSRASFTPKGGFKSIPLEVEQLSGQGDADASMAIRRASLFRQPYFVTLKPLSQTPFFTACPIGKSGVVKFSDLR